MKVLGGAGGGGFGERGLREREAGGETSAGGGGGGGGESSNISGVKSYTMWGNLCDRNCWRPLFVRGEESISGGGGRLKPFMLSRGGGGGR